MRRPWVPAAVLLGLSGLVVGCSPEDQAASADTSRRAQATIEPNTTGTVPVPPATLNTAKPTDAAVPPELPEVGTAPPPATAGPLTARNLPDPAKLGPGWKTYNDPGGHEAGFRGNNTWTRRREAHQAAFEALPAGCAGSLPTGSLPVPLHALQGSYKTAAGRSATVLLLRFAEPDQATGYFSGYQSRMKSCGTGGDLTVKPLWADQTSAAALRQYQAAEHFTEVSVVEQTTVALLAAEAGPQDRSWTTATAGHLRQSIAS